MWTTQDFAKQENHVDNVTGIHFLPLSKTYKGTDHLSVAE